MIIGEAPGREEEVLSRPFVGTSGKLLDSMLGEAGISRSECFVTNVCRIRPENNDITTLIAQSKKDLTIGQWLPMHDKNVKQPVHDGYLQLLKEIDLVKPRVIVPVGNVPLWAISKLWGITKWRGSTLRHGNSIVVPTYHPAAILRQWEWRAIAVNDLRRVARIRNGEMPVKPDWKFIIRPSFDVVQQTLFMLDEMAAGSEVLRISFDLETRNGHIACAGLSWTLLDAICIPFMQSGSAQGYWTTDQEAWIIWALCKLLTHKNVQVVGQNILYDCQYTWRHWHFVPNVYQDCMISQHSIFSDLPKSLAFQASMYCKYYVYWKDEGKDWREGQDEGQLWYYNCEDCVYTDEVGRVELETVKKMGLEEVHRTQQQLFWPVLRAMQLGVRIDHDRRKALTQEVHEQIKQREEFLAFVLGHTLNPRSFPQMSKFFYEDLKQPVVLKRGKKGAPPRPSLDDEALQTISKREPLLRPIINAISDIRTLGIFLSHFLEKPLDEDGRMRCSYNIGGSESGKSAPKTYRLSSSENAFGSGTNLQNIPSEKSKSLGKSAARGSIAAIGDPYQFPNLRSMFVPDSGKTFFDGDLDRADLQIVCWEAEDEMLKTALRMGADIHLLNAFVLQGREPPPLEELVEFHAKYQDHRQPLKLAREFAKVFCHGCVTRDHEVLTRNGWKFIDEVADDEEIAVWEPEGQFINFEVPSGWNRDIAKAGENLVLLLGQAYSQLVTADHRMPYVTDDTAVKVTTADDLITRRSARLPKSGKFCGEQHASDAALIVAFIADGSMDEYGNVYFHFYKERKKERLRLLLEGYTYFEYPDKFYIPHREAKFTRFGKAYNSWLLGLDGSTLDTILAEQEFWDGSRGSTGAVNVSSVDRDSLEWLRTIAHLRNKASQYQGTHESGFGSTVHRISINNRPWATLQCLEATERILLDRDVKVYCPKTTTGFFMVRREGKISVTGNTNYVGSARTMAAHTGRTIHEVDRAQKIWFGAHPGIKRWHVRVETQIRRHKFVENAFGYRWYIFDRVDAILPEAVAWIPQSTVSNVINKIWIKLYNELPEVEVLLQVHDSLCGQMPSEKTEALSHRIVELSKIVVPYSDPLVIPFSVKLSDKSWGDVEDMGKYFSKPLAA